MKLKLTPEQEERIRRAEREVIRWAVAVVRRPNADHAAHDRHLRDAVDEYEVAMGAVQELKESCAHPHARPVSAPLSGESECYCEDCDSYFLMEDEDSEP